MWSKVTNWLNFHQFHSRQEFTLYIILFFGWYQIQIFVLKFLPFLFVIFHLFLNFIFTEKIPPVFTVNPPVQMLISSGGKASMTCKASGFPIPLITWFKDGILVPRANTTEEKGLSTWSLEFVKAVNQGKYWCEANNSVGWQRSLITKLSVSQGISCPSFHRCNTRKWIRS